MYEEGQGIDVDHEKAIALYKDIFNKNGNAAIRLYKLLSEQGNYEAINEL